MVPGERFNSISHLIGAVLALGGGAVLVTLAALDGHGREIVGYSVYCATLFLLYLVSALYHGLSGPAKKVFHRLDHVAIYLLIAGTYTPFTMVALEGALGWWIFGIVWGLATVGMTLDLLPRRESRSIQMVIYVVMGWLCVVVLEPILAALPPLGFFWLVAGGLVYTFGVVFFALSDRYPRCHWVWHLCVLAGSAAHYGAVLLMHWHGH